MASAVNIGLTLLATSMVAIALTSAGVTPPECCTSDQTKAIADKCTTTGIQASNSICFTNSVTGVITDRCDYIRCAPCGNTWCMSRLKCSQPCVKYLNNGVCTCWNYFSATTKTCTNTPPAGLTPCPDATIITTASTTSTPTTTTTASTTSTPTTTTTASTTSTPTTTTASTTSTPTATTATTGTPSAISTTLDPADPVAPADTCARDESQAVAETCTEAGIQKSKSVCFKNAANQTIPSADYFICQPCGGTWCMAKLNCYQPCYRYVDPEGYCSCWNYFNENSFTCTALPTDGLTTC